VRWKRDRDGSPFRERRSEVDGGVQRELGYGPGGAKLGKNPLGIQDYPQTNKTFWRTRLGKYVRGKWLIERCAHFKCWGMQREEIVLDRNLPTEIFT